MADPRLRPARPGTPGSVPRSRTLDESLAFLREGYTFGGRRFRRLGSDVFTTRLAGRPATVMFGAT